MPLTGKNVYEELSSIAKRLVEIQESNVVDCSNDDLLLISSVCTRIYFTSGRLDRTYNTLYENLTKRDKS